MKTFPTYEQAIKLPKGGAVAMDANNIQANAADMIGRRHCINGKALYNWANLFDISLITKGYILSKIENNELILSDVLNNEFVATKNILK